MMKKAMLGLGFMTLFLGSLDAKPTPAAYDAPVVPGQWHSNLTAAKAKAAELGAPLLVYYSQFSCGICTAFDLQLDRAECVNYFATRGIVMV